MKKIQKLRKVWGALVVIGVLGGLAMYTHTVRSSALQNMSGYAWGGDWTDQDNDGVQDLNPANTPFEPTGGVGWISFNCTTGGNCGADDYGVNIEANGDLVGYAWSSNYGWLKFGGLSGFPTGGGTTPANAKLTGNNITGWARFCAGAADPNNCSGTVANPENGGWDGWLALSGSNYGITLDTGTGILSGYAWGGNDGGKNVVGWVNFNTDFGEVIYDPVEGPAVFLEAESNSVPSGGQVELSWSGDNLINSTTGCEATVGSPGWAGDRTSPTGTFNTSPADGDYTYTIRCLGEDGVTWSDPSSVEVTVGVNLILSASNTYAYPPLYEGTLNWATDPADAVVTNCVASNNATGGGNTNWPGPDNPNPQDNPPSSALVYVTNPSVTYTLTCQSGSGTISDTEIILQNDLPEDVEFNYDVVTCGGGLCTTTLSWELTNADSCTASTENPSSGTGWGGNIPVPPNSGNQPGVQVPAVAPDVTTYRLSCVMDSGQTITRELFLNNETGESLPPQYNEN